MVGFPWLCQWVPVVVFEELTEFCSLFILIYLNMSCDEMRRYWLNQSLLVFEPWLDDTICIENWLLGQYLAWELISNLHWLNLQPSLLHNYQAELVLLSWKVFSQKSKFQGCVWGQQSFISVILKKDSKLQIQKLFLWEEGTQHQNLSERYTQPILPKYPEGWCYIPIH